MIRKRNDSEGYLRGSKGFANEERAFRKTSSDPWNPTPINGADGWGETIDGGWGIDGNDGDRGGYSTLLRNVMPNEGNTDQGCDVRNLNGKDLWNLVEENGNGFTGPLRPRQND